MAAFTHLPYLPDWSEGIAARYSFSTALHLSQTTLEQRAALRAYPHREVSYAFSGRKADQQSLVNKLISLLKSKMIVPLFFEQILCTAITLEGTQGGGAVDILTCVDVANRYNLAVANQADAPLYQNIVVFDKSETYPPTSYRVNTISGNSITLGEELDYGYSVSNMLIFPAIVGYLKSYEKTLETDSVSTIRTVFAELESWYDKSLG